MPHSSISTFLTTEGTNIYLQNNRKYYGYMKKYKYLLLVKVAAEE